MKTYKESEEGENDIWVLLGLLLALAAGFILSNLKDNDEKNEDIDR